MVANGTANFGQWRRLVSLCDSLRHQKVTRGAAGRPFWGDGLLPHVQLPDFFVSPVDKQSETNQPAYIDVLQTANHVPCAKLNEQRVDDDQSQTELGLSLIHISEPTRLLSISYAVFCLKKKIS